MEKISLNDITPANYNPRQMDKSEKEKLTRSIEKYGLVEPLIINLKENNRIIAGHQRYEVLKELKEQELILIKNGDIGLILSEDDIKISSTNDEKALNIALNKINGEWDYDKLQDVLKDLELSDIDINLTGFDDIEIEDILFNPDENLTYNEIEDNINEAIGKIYEDLDYVEENIENTTRIITFHTEDEDLFIKFLEYMKIPLLKKNIRRKYKLEDLKCLQNMETD